MRKSDKPGAPQRRIWRMTPEAPHGEFVEAGDSADRPVAQPGPDELQPSSYVRSSWDLLNGLEVTESAVGDLHDSLFDQPPQTAPISPVAPARERARNAGEWIRRFSIRLAELDLQRDPKELIELAKRHWMTKHYLAPEEAAELAHATDRSR
ncbi:MAG: hypothetical protein ABIQ33_11995 [Caldimonas sp.]